MKKKYFPADFLWGAATSAYQIEGATRTGGKGLSIWDAFSNTPGRIVTGETGDIACDHYNRFHEDVRLMADMKLPAYRFSISWPRIQPDGRDKPNQDGIRFYSDLIDRLLDHDIQPWVTLYHWDLPLALQLEKDGWLNDEIARYFTDYAEICFDHFGDRVKNWITINEPWVVAMLGYGQGVFAPGRTSNTEPYVAGHNLLRAHARAVDVYRTRYQHKQGGRIGITNNCDWREPLTDAAEDKKAAEEALEFFLGWFADPIYKGDYPKVMRTNLGDRLPLFRDEDYYLIRDSSDFFGLNHYTTLLASRPQPGDAPSTSVYGNGGLMDDQNVLLQADPSWNQTSMGWNIVPWGCTKLLQWIQKRYDPADIFITENGAAFDDPAMLSGTDSDQILEDPQRIRFLHAYLDACHTAIQAGVELKGYFCWSLMDNFEWASGNSIRFGLHHVDFNTLQRTPKRSALWYAGVIRKNALDETTS